LFYGDNPPWIVVFSDEMLARKRLVKPNYPRSVVFSQMGSPVDNMISADENLEEKFGICKCKVMATLAQCILALAIM
jgi:hypothetical protein